MPYTSPAHCVSGHNPGWPRHLHETCTYKYMSVLSQYCHIVDTFHSDSYKLKPKMVSYLPPGWTAEQLNTARLLDIQQLQLNVSELLLLEGGLLGAAGGRGSLKG